MNSQKQTESIWIVVKVSRGFPAMAEAYSDSQVAYAREEALRFNMNIEYDETDVFEVQIKDVAPIEPVRVVETITVMPKSAETT